MKLKNYELRITNYLAVILMLTAYCLPPAVFAQMSRKPTPTREPAGVMDKSPDSKKNSLLEIKSQADFDSIGRTYHQNTPYALPHAMFVIDRKEGNKIYYVNSQRFRFHKDFLYATGLAPLGTDIYKAAYFSADRRFIVGTIAWQKTVEKWTWEMWEGDLATAERPDKTAPLRRRLKRVLGPGAQDAPLKSRGTLTKRWDPRLMRLACACRIGYSLFIQGRECCSTDQHRRRRNVPGNAQAKGLWIF